MYFIFYTLLLALAMESLQRMKFRILTMAFSTLVRRFGQTAISSRSKSYRSFVKTARGGYLGRNAKHSTGITIAPTRLHCAAAAAEIISVHYAMYLRTPTAPLQSWRQCRHRLSARYL